MKKGRTTRASWKLQALVFLNAAEAAQDLTDRLVRGGYPSAFVSGAQAQVHMLLNTTAPIMSLNAALASGY